MIYNCLLKKGWMGGWVDELMGGWVDGWMGGWCWDGEHKGYALLYTFAPSRLIIRGRFLDENYHSN